MQPLVLVDLLAIFPFYLPFVTRLDLRFLRILRIFRVFRVLKLERYFVTLSKVVRVIKRKASEIISTFIVMFILIVLAASLMYYVEPQTYDSIPHAMWWGIVTLTTVGYGDVYPQTALGQLIGSILALLGIGLFGIPAGILAAGFIEEIQSKKNRQEVG
ncbi:ion transporter [Mesotoga sp.]|uniref:ion transporter n=1 Tax=Mesotoga sp. TaxID=2053577 RepID=UPI00345EA142